MALNILFLVAGRFSGVNECLIKTFSKNNRINLIDVINPTIAIRSVWGKLRLSSFLNSFLEELVAINEYGREWKYYERAQVFVMPSLFEPWGNVWIEAMTYQLPCIGTNVGSIPYIIEDGKTGFIVKPKNPKEIAERLIYLFENPHIMEQFGREGFLKAVKNFTWDRVVDTIVKEIAVTLVVTLKEKLNKSLSTE